MTKYSVTIKNSDETMLGGVAASEVAMINMDASMAEFEHLVRAELEGCYDAEYIFEYGPFGGPSIVVLLDEPWNNEDRAEAEEISNVVQQVGERVFESGQFWVSYSTKLRKIAIAVHDNEDVCGCGRPDCEVIHDVYCWLCDGDNPSAYTLDMVDKFVMEWIYGEGE